MLSGAPMAAVDVVPPAGQAQVTAQPQPDALIGLASPLAAVPQSVSLVPIIPLVVNGGIQSAATPPPAPGAEEPLVVVGRSRRGDPLSEINAESFGITQEIDEAFVGPIARAYKDELPKPIRSGIRNFLNNLREPIVAVNYLLQLKPGKAAETVGRFVVNTTIGVGGLVDLAKHPPFKLPRRRNGFANTLGYYGVKQGPFFYLPLLGATTLRDLFGNTVDQVFGPLNNIKPFNKPEFVLPLATLSAIDSRAEFDEELEAIRATRDPYAATRKFYLDRRQAEIDALRGRPFVMPVPGEGAMPAVVPEPEPATPPQGE